MTRAPVLLPHEPVPSWALTPEPDGSVKATRVPPDMHRLRWETPPGPPIRFDGPAAYCAIGPAITIDVIRYGAGFDHGRRERRQAARARGRRRAVAVPVSERWEVRVAAHPDVPAGYVQAFAEEHAACIERLWLRKPRRAKR